MITLMIDVMLIITAGGMALGWAIAMGRGQPNYATAFGVYAILAMLIHKL